MKICVIGQGYVGLTISIGAANAGHEVIGFDINQELIQNLINGLTFVPGISKGTLLGLQSSRRLVFSNKKNDFSDSEVVIIAVPTPLTDTRDPDLSILSSAALMIAENLRTNSLIINESTSYPGTLRNLIKPIFDSNSEYQFEFASAPERVDPGNFKWELKNTPRVIGGLTSTATEKAANLYNSFCENVVIVSSPEVAEAAKLFENTFRQVNIALVNEFAQIAHALKFSSQEAITAAATKPFGFMAFYPSIGVGGHCIPVDPSYLSYAAEKVGIKTKFINIANQINLNMVSYVVDRINKDMSNSIKGLRIQIAGISYKSNISDLRESPALNLISELERYGASVQWFDPLVDLELQGRSDDLVTDIDLGLIVTPHDVIDFSIWKKAKVKVLDLSADSKNYGWPKFL
jgi:UDP-N-acetyl-D-glucosamine dehydrogenase